MKRRTELRRIEFVRGFTKHAAGSVLVKWGDTWVLCTASVEDKVPPFLKDTGRGWVTAEYSMLPSSTGGGRYVELQGTAEHKPFTEESLDALRSLARKGIRRIFSLMG